MVWDLLHTPPCWCAWFIDCPVIAFEPPCTPLWLITWPPFALAALPPVPSAEDDWVGVVDSAPSPSEDAEVPPEAALPPEPTTPLALSGLTLAAPVPTVEADVSLRQPGCGRTGHE